MLVRYITLFKSNKYHDLFEANMIEYIVKQNRNRLLQSSIAFGSALLLTLIFHEFGHGLTARLIYGLHPTVYGLHEDDIASSHTAIGVIASAGPLIGLLIGLVFLFF